MVEHETETPCTLGAMATIFPGTKVEVSRVLLRPLFRVSAVYLSTASNGHRDYEFTDWQNKESMVKRFNSPELLGVTPGSLAWHPELAYAG